MTPERPSWPPAADLQVASIDRERRFADQGEIGVGGTSSLRLLFDQALRRDVVLKTLRPELAEVADLRRRFIEEARIMGQLDHPNIVSVHDLGLDAEGRPFLLMQRIRGRTFEDELADAGPVPIASERSSALMQAYLKICDGIAFAHSRGVVHCDLKPANVMVGGFGETYILDWGIARVLTKDGRGSVAPGVRPAGVRSQERGVFGTPAYLAPEQARGLLYLIDARTDVFAMGAVLYQVLTGKAPYEGDHTPEEAVELACRGEVVPPQQRAGKIPVPPGLCRIAMKAMSASPDERYASMVEMKSEVERFLRGVGRFESQDFAAGDLIVEEGDEGDFAYVITRGRCTVFKGHDAARVDLRELGPGEVFGEMAVVSRGPRSASVQALEPTTVMMVSRKALADGMGLSSWAGVFVTALAERFREADARLAALERRRPFPGPR